jgi:hypothetical protein
MAGSRAASMNKPADMPPQLRSLLLQLFGTAIDDVEIVEYSWTSAILGWPEAVTNSRRIFLRHGTKDFFDYPELVVHEYFHVIKQWRTGRLTLLRYLIESLRHGYWNNPFEIEAREFAARHGRSQKAAAPAINLEA